MLIARDVERDHVEAALEGSRAQLDALRDGTLIALLADPRFPDAPMLRALRAGLTIVEAAPGARVTVTAGKAYDHQGSIEGEAFDRAASLRIRKPGLFVDSDTASLIGDRFVLAENDGSLQVTGEGTLSRRRLLLGKPTPTVGRHAELAQLEALVEGVADEQAPRLGVVLGAAGQGKSRIRDELMARLSQT